MQEMKPQTNVLDLLPKLQSMALADRAVFEKGMKAFVSYVQAYAKHECHLIFRVKGNSRQGWPRLLLWSEFGIRFGRKLGVIVHKLQLPIPNLKFILQHQILTKVLCFQQLVSHCFQEETFN